MLRVSICCCQLLLLTQVWHVIYGDADATMEVVATCNEDALLSCQVVHDPQVAFKGISWYKIDEKDGGLSKTGWEKLQYNKDQNYSRQLNSSSEVSNSKWYSLRIENATNYNSGKYKCILETSARKYNESNTITLIVKGCPPQLEEATFTKHRAELALLCSLGLFYLLLIFVACSCLKDNGSQDFHKSRKRHISNSLFYNNTYRKNNSSGTGNDQLDQQSLQTNVLKSVETHQQPQH
ncbi:CD83 antigen [Sphaerodactylus townsendi]|uniref:CD83 antigen n=1 Tax=Sphaerodactylus townsendi TaxID=933632 RepID=UPI002026A7AA|nr:CD83 antigen [Sphaerodactylus townsendi]